MPRVLSFVTTPLAPHEREAFVARARERQRAAKGVGCNYWVFSRDEELVSMVEFFEAGDSSTLERAQRAAGMPAPSLSIFREVEL